MLPTIHCWNQEVAEGESNPKLAPDEAYEAKPPPEPPLPFPDAPNDTADASLEPKALTCPKAGASSEFEPKAPPPKAPPPNADELSELPPNALPPNALEPSGALVLLVGAEAKEPPPPSEGLSGA